MKKYMTLAALLVAGSICANAENLLVHYAFNDDYTDSTKQNSFGNADSLTYGTHTGALAGLDGYLDCQNNKALWNGTTEGFIASDMAVSMLVCADALPVGTNAEYPDWTAQWIFGGGSVGNNGAKLGIGSDGQLKFSLHNVSGAGLASGTEDVLTTGTWYQIGFSVETLSDSSKTLKLWLNGSVVATKENYDYSLAWGNKMALVEGNDACASRFDGGLDEVKVWSLSSGDDVSALMSKEASVIPEPSAFGLLAGVGALAFVASRRRRR